MTKYCNLMCLIIILSLFCPQAPAQSEGGASPFSQAKFVPDISLILDFSYAYRDVDNKEFQLNYLELAVGATVDPFFDLFTVLQVADGEIGIEEAYAKTRSLPLGLQLKVGQFLSSFGRLNSQHDHCWNFSMQPLVYRDFFGESNLNEKGVQLNWVAPLDIFLQAGLEVLAGENEESFGGDGNDSHLLVSFLKSSFDIGPVVLLGGASYASGKYELLLGSGAESGAPMLNSRILGLDLTLKYLIDSYRYLSLQAEYLRRDLDGVKRSGGYADLIWRSARRWRMGVRYDWIHIQESYHRMSAMLEFSPSEFSRIRLQYTHDRSRELDLQLEPVNEVVLQFNLSIGAHGAHPF